MEGSEHDEIRGQEDCGSTGMPIYLLRAATVVQDPVPGIPGSVIVMDSILCGHLDMENGSFTYVG